nr:hypothetical protein [Lactiplantibacillus plantarum]
MTNEQRVIHIIKTTPALMTILQLIQDCHLKQGASALVASVILFGKYSAGSQ